MNYYEYIRTELLILIPVLYFIGLGLKKSKLPDKWIPCVLGMFSVILSSLWVISNCNIGNIAEAVCAIFTAVTQGIMLAGTSVFVNQLYLQSKKKD